MYGGNTALQGAEAASLAWLLDRLCAGVLVVGHDLELVYANRKGREVLAWGDPIRTVAGRVVGGRADGGLTSMLRGRDGSTQLSSGDQSRSLILVAEAGPVDGQTMLWVLDPVDGSPDCAWLAAAYKLTETECRVVKALASGLTTEEAAEAQGISIATLRTHLQRIYAKTGVKNQAGLVRLGHLRPSA